MNISIENQKQIDSLLSVLKKLLGQDLHNVSLYGSAVDGGLRKYSDIDLLSISSRNLTSEEINILIQNLLNISGKYMLDEILKPIELTLVNISEINPWQYPPKFDFQYGEWLRNQFENGENNPWKSKLNPDLTIVLKQASESGIVLSGSPLKDLIAPIPPKDFILACTDEIDNLLEDLKWDTRNVLLTLCRIWYSVENLRITSKDNAVDWVVERVPDPFKEILIHAKYIYIGLEEENWGKYVNNIIPCAEHLNDRIKLSKNRKY